MARIEPSAIAYQDELIPRYSAGLDSAESYDALKKHIEEWKILAWDAWDAAQGWSRSKWRRWRRALAKERSGEFSGEAAMMEGFGTILVPEILLYVGLIASEHKVPEGLAFKRLVEVGALRQQNGRMVRQEK